jgi:indole-3-glycerol phosphate synthase
MNILDEIVEHKRREVAERKRMRPLNELRADAEPPRDFTAALQRPGLSVIAEFKRRSPSKGALRETADATEIATAYAASGAAALSILTDQEFFGGDDSDLQAARAAVELPTIRKDFTIDEYQIHEARAIGADAVLLIVRILTNDEIRSLVKISSDLGMAALVETHTGQELDRALHCGAKIIGVNSRDLDTFEVNVDKTLEMKRQIPSYCVAVAESGIHTRADVEGVATAGYDGMLVGEALMRADNPGRKLAELLGTSA